MREAEKAKVRHRITAAIEKAKKKFVKAGAKATERERHLEQADRLPPPGAHFFSDHPKLGPLMGFIALGAGLSQRHTVTGVWLCMVGACAVTLLWAHDIAKKRKDNSLAGTLKGLPWCAIILALGWWLNEPPYLNIVFKNPDKINFYRRLVVSREITYFVLYMSDIGFEVPKAIPPIGVGEELQELSGGGFQTITLTTEQIADRREIVWSYSHVIMYHLLIGTSNTAIPSQQDLHAGVAASILSAYLACSYLNDASWVKNSVSLDPWFISLWELRHKFSATTIDRAIMYGLPGMVAERDSKNQNAGSMGSFMRGAVSGGLLQMSSNWSEDMTKYNSILKGHGITLDEKPVTVDHAVIPIR